MILMKLLWLGYAAELASAFTLPPAKRLQEKQRILSDTRSDDRSVDHQPKQTSHTLQKIPSRLVNTLDLAPLMNHVASYACTKRGKDAIIDLVYTPSPTVFSILDEGGRRPSLFGNNGNKRKRDWYGGGSNSQRLKHDKYATYHPPISVAQTAEEAILEYDLVREAMEILQSQQSTKDGSTPMSLPPMFQLYDGVSSSGIDSDDDEWIELCLNPLPPGMDVYQEIDLQTILQAEQVVKLLIETYEWTLSDTIKWNAPGLVNVVQQMGYTDEDAGEIDVANNEGNIGTLLDLYNTLKGAIEIVRAGPNLSDMNNQFSYLFQLAGNGRFPELDILYQKEETILNQKKEDNSQKLAIVRNEISLLEDRIKRKLITSMMRGAQDVQRGMNSLARLDVIFAKASFGCDWEGVIPCIGKKGQIHVEKFVHPVLALSEVDNSSSKITPVDLIIPGDEGYQALMISGPNGGGKTIALKSFGLIAMMFKLGLPVTISRNAQENKSPPIVDYFEDILVEVGDTQSISKHESTLMARLNALSDLIHTMSSSMSHEATLVLLDELGGGTDPVAGSCLAQSILEKIISINSNCKLVATTHSPQLKALSISDDRFESASVLMSKDKHPTFELSYSSTGESYALEAARRARPQLPDDVLDRAADLMNGGDESAVDTLKQYLLALEEEQKNAKELGKKTKQTWNEVCEYKDDMISKIEVSKMHLSRLESRLQSIFDTLKNNKDNMSSYELVGDCLEELRLLKRRVQTEEELLLEKGLRRIPDSYSFYHGESVVIIADGELKGFDAVVKIQEKEDDASLVTVVPVLDIFTIDEEDTEPLVLKRRDVAIYDYPDAYPDESYSSTKQKQTNDVLSVLSTLNTSSSKASTSTTKTNEEKTFTSARQRKAAAAKQKKGKNKGKKK